MKNHTSFARFLGISGALFTLMAFGSTASAQVVRGEVGGIPSGGRLNASSAYSVDTTRHESSKEWVSVAAQQRENRKTFEFGVKGGISGLAIKNAASVDIKGLGGNTYQIINRCRYIDENTPRSERNNRVSWNVSAFGRYNFGVGGNLQVEVNYNENRYETRLTYQSDPDNYMSTGTVYDRAVKIPLLIGWKYSFFRMYMGPQFNVWTSYKNQYEPLKQGVTDPSLGLFRLQDVNVKHSLVEFTCGFAFEIQHFLIDFRYYTPFKEPVQRFYSEGNNEPTEFKIGMHTFQVSVGAMF